MPDYNATTVRSGLAALFDAAPVFEGWNPKQTRTYIRVGEYSLALDDLAHAFLDSGKTISPEHFQLFETLAAQMEMETNPEFQGVARLRATDPHR